MYISLRFWASSIGTPLFRRDIRVDKSDTEIQRELREGGKLPRHIAIIMDGNTRWARGRGLRPIEGHRAGVDTVRDIVEAAGQLGIEVLTLYTFSTENWKRPRREVLGLMNLLRETVVKETPELARNNVRLRTIGRTDAIPGSSRRALLEAIEETSSNTGLILNLALNYGGRAEIIDAVRGIASEIEAGRLRTRDVDEKLLSRHLYTSGLPDPDLLIRTSGELRVSNFLLWQIAYSEMWVTDMLWPDFRREHLYDAIRSYQSRERRFGAKSRT